MNLECNFDPKKFNPGIKLSFSGGRSHRVESYLHSDSTTENKKGSIVRVSAKTDFAVRTEEFKQLCNKIAQLSCGFQTTDIDEIFNQSDLKDFFDTVQDNLNEEIKVDFIFLMN